MRRAVALVMVMLLSCLSGTWARVRYNATEQDKSEWLSQATEHHVESMVDHGGSMGESSGYHGESMVDHGESTEYHGGNMGEHGESTEYHGGNMGEHGESSEYHGDRMVEGESSHTTNDIWVELVALRDIVMLQKIELYNIEAKLQNTEMDNVGNEHIQFTNNVEINGVSDDQTTGQTATSVDIRADLKELRDMVVEQRVELSVMCAEGKLLKKKVEQLERENAALEARVTTSEHDNAAQAMELSAMGARVTACESENADVVARVTGSAKEVAVLREEMSVSQKDQPKVAFYASLSDSELLGPFKTETPIVYSRVFTNVGQAYDPTTGVFSAPVRGVYYFRFTAYDSRRSGNMGVHLYHNDDTVMYNTYSTDRGAHMSNALALELAEGDTVYMHLPSGNGLYDDTNNHCTFSGFLLFPM